MQSGNSTTDKLVPSSEYTTLTQVQQANIVKGIRAILCSTPGQKRRFQEAMTDITAKLGDKDVKNLTYPELRIYISEGVHGETSQIGNIPKVKIVVCGTMPHLFCLQPQYAHAIKTEISIYIPLHPEAPATPNAACIKCDYLVNNNNAYYKTVVAAHGMLPPYLDLHAGTHKRMVKGVVVLGVLRIPMGHLPVQVTQFVTHIVDAFALQLAKECQYFEYDDLISLQAILGQKFRHVMEDIRHSTLDDNFTKFRKGPLALYLHEIPEDLQGVFLKVDWEIQHLVMNPAEKGDRRHERTIVYSSCKDAKVFTVKPENPNPIFAGTCKAPYDPSHVELREALASQRANLQNHMGPPDKVMQATLADNGVSSLLGKVYSQSTVVTECGSKGEKLLVSAPVILSRFGSNPVTRTPRAADGDAGGTAAAPAAAAPAAAAPAAAAPAPDVGAGEAAESDLPVRTLSDPRLKDGQGDCPNQDEEMSNEEFLRHDQKRKWKPEDIFSAIPRESKESKKPKRA